jgi:hypothetical protein
MSEEPIRPIKVDLPNREGMEMYEYLVIDRSGSMQGISTTVIKQVNEYLANAKKIAAETKIPTFVSILLFDHENLPHLNFAPIEEATPLTTSNYVPRGWTALNDAVGVAIDELRARLSGRETEVSVTISVFTDGYENKSTRYVGEGNKELSGLITEISNMFHWTVVYVGAGMEGEVRERARGLGIDASNTLNFTADNVGASRAFESMAKGLVSKSMMYCSSAGDTSTLSAGYFKPSNPAEITGVNRSKDAFIKDLVKNTEELNNSSV